ncbi:MAG: NupC/NupG family nucleoside CNT transporter [Mitsuokella sp.]
MFLFRNMIGIFVFLGIAVLFSKKRHEIRWRSACVLFVLNLVLAGFLMGFEAGRRCVRLAADGFHALIQIAFSGIAFVFPDWVNVPQMNFFTAVLLPILFIVPLFDILTYFGILPFLIRWVGKGLSCITGAPKFEAFFSIEMMFLGNSEALAVSKFQLSRMKADRCLTVGLMSMSCVTAPVVASYTQLMPPAYVLAAIPLNVVNALLVSSILHPVKIAPEEDIAVTIRTDDAECEPFFSYLANSILSAGRLVLIIGANVIAFVALAKFLDVCLGAVYAGLSLETILGCILFPFAWLMGLSASEAFQIAQYMGEKLITNEFVVMLSLKDVIHTYSPHVQAVLTVFLTSFANLTTIGILLGTFRTLVDTSRHELIARNVAYLALAGLLVSLLSAAMAGLFVW